MRSENGVGLQVGRYAGSPTNLALSVASNRTAVLKPGTVYRLWSSVDSFFKWGDASVTAATTDHPLKAGLDVMCYTDDTNLFLAGVVSSGTGTLFISEIAVAN
jgi:hypothetical protein